MQKLYYSISEISKIVDEETHILRYWEKEFDQLAPRKNRAGNRIYSQYDLELIQIIKKLIREEKLSLKGARIRLDRHISEKMLSQSVTTGTLFEESIKNKTPAECSEKPGDIDLSALKDLLVEVRNYLLK